MTAWFLLSMLIFLLAGCTSLKYINADSIDADFKEDTAECTQQILKTTIEANLVAENSKSNEKATTTPTTNAPLRQRIEQCLQSKGWRLETDVN